MDNLLQKYREAFDALEPRAIASLYTVPCSTSDADADGANIFSTREPLIDKFEKNCVAMKDMGYRHSEFNILSSLDLGENSKSINIGWRVQFETGQREFRSLYICHKVNSQWSIFSANVYEGSFFDDTQQ